MDETGLLYCLTPDRKVESQQTEGTKYDKAHVKFALTCDADGLEKTLLVLIGHAENPQ